MRDINKEEFTVNTIFVNTVIQINSLSFLDSKAYELSFDDVEGSDWVLQREMIGSRYDHIYSFITFILNYYRADWFFLLAFVNKNLNCNQLK